MPSALNLPPWESKSMIPPGAVSGDGIEVPKKVLDKIRQ